MKNLKFLIFTISTIVFFISLTGYYFVSVIYKKGKFDQLCNIYYCFDFLDLGDFLAILLAIIGLVAVVISLDSWKTAQQYNENRELLMSTKIELQQIKEELLYAYARIPLDHRHMQIVSFVGRIGKQESNLDKLEVEDEYINLITIARKELFKLLGDKFIGNASIDDSQIITSNSTLMVNINKAVNKLEEYDMEKLSKLKK